MFGSHRRGWLIGLTALGASGVALAGVPNDPLFLATQGDTLYRFGLAGAVQSFTLNDTVIAMAEAPNGVIYAVSEKPGAGAQGAELYRLDNAFGAAPTLTLLDDDLTRLYPSITFIGNELYGFNNLEDTLVEIDLGTFNETPVGATGATGLQAVGGSGYDAGGDVLYAMEGLSAPENLFTVDYSLTGGPDPTATLVGPLGHASLSLGGEFHDGDLWLATNNADTGFFELGRVNTATGFFTADRTIAGALQINTSLIAVPTPGSLGALSIAGLCAMRRRR